MPAVFEKVSITVPVPATAVQAQLVFLHGGTDWWFAEPKSEEGQSATPYNVNYAGQLTYITPNGIYTGMVTTGQIVVTGSIAQPDETLETRLVTINNNAINLSATQNSQDSRITTIEAGQITLTSAVNGKVGIGVDYKGVTIDAVNGFTSTATVGGKTIVTKANSVEGISIYNGSTKVFGVDTGGRVFATSLSNIYNSTYYMTYGYLTSPGIECYGPNTPVDPNESIKWFNLSKLIDNGFAMFDVNEKRRMDVSPDGAIRFYDHNETTRFSLLANGGITFYDHNGMTRFSLLANGGIRFDDHNGKIRENFLPDGGIELIDPNGQQVFAAAGGASTSVEIICKSNNGMKIGVDATGPYYVKAGVKTYF